jgi:hypothetical protein
VREKKIREVLGWWERVAGESWGEKAENRVWDEEG